MITFQGGYSKVTDILPLAIAKELKIEGFLVGRWKARWVEGIRAMAAWVISGQVQVKETLRCEDVRCCVVLGVRRHN